MTTNRPETVADVIVYIRARAAEMKENNDECGHYNVGGDEPSDFWDHDSLAVIADRIEAALKRSTYSEREAFIEAARNTGDWLLCQGEQSLMPVAEELRDAYRALVAKEMEGGTE